MYFSVGVGGIIGSLLRFYLSVVFSSVTLDNFPIATLLVNLLGTFLLGLLTPLLNFFNVNRYIVNGLCTGLIGSFTTFSALSIDFLILYKDCNYLMAFSYLFITIVGGLLCGVYSINLSKKYINKIRRRV